MYYVAVVILIIALIFIAISLYSSNSNLYPPVASKNRLLECPGNDDNVTCNNIKGLGNSGVSGGPIKPQSDFPETNDEFILSKI